MQLAAGLARLRGSSFVRHSSLVFASAMLINIGTFVFNAGTSRLLGVKYYGALYALMALLALVSVPATALATVVTKFAAEFRALKDEARLHGLVRRLTQWLALAATLTVLAGVLLQSPISAFFNVPRSAVVSASLLIGMMIGLPPLRAVFQGVEDFGRYALSSALEGVLKTAAGILLAMLGFGITGALAGYAAGGAIALAYTWAALERTYGGAAGEFHFDLRRLLQTSSGALVAIATFIALGYADALIVKHYMSPGDAGLYAAVSLGGKVLLYVTSFIPLVLLPKATHRVTVGSSPLPVLAGAAAMWAVLSAVGLLAFYYAPDLVIRVLVGPQFLSAAPLMFGYALAMSLLGAMYLIASYKIALHRFDFVYPFILLTVAELTTIVLYHPDLRAVIAVLLIGNACGVLASLYRIGNSARS